MVRGPPPLHCGFMGRFKDSVHEVLGQLFRHSDIDRVLGSDDLDLPQTPVKAATRVSAPSKRGAGKKAPAAITETLGDSLIDAVPVAPSALADAAAPPKSNKGRSRSGKSSAAIRPVAGPTPREPGASEGEIARVGPANLDPMASVVRAPIRLEKRVASPQTQTRSKTRAARQGKTAALKPVPELRPLPAPEGVGAPPEALAKLPNLKDELSLRLKGEMALAEDDPPRKAAIAALLRHTDRGRIELPPLPASARRLREAKARTDDDALVAVIRGDPAIAGRVVRLANAPFFAGVMPVTTLPMALARVGLHQCRTVAVAAAYESALLPGVAQAPLVELQRRGAATGAAAEALASAAEVDPDLAALAGLLHDAGQIVARRALVPAVAGLPEREVARLALAHHLMLGVMLAQHWDLPSEVTAAIGWHHHPESAPAEGRRLTWLIHVASTLADRALAHGRSRMWQDFLAARGLGDAASDGVESVQCDDLVSAWPGKADAALFHAAVRTTLMRTASADIG